MHEYSAVHNQPTSTMVAQAVCYTPLPMTALSRGQAPHLQGHHADHADEHGLAQSIHVIYGPLVSIAHAEVRDEKDGLRIDKTL